MIRLTIDNLPTEVPDGTTILDAAKALGISIPTLCHMPGREALTTCFLCVVKVQGRENLLPACATAVSEGMVVQTATDEVLAARRTCLELLFSDHAGDCTAPCQRACPAATDIPVMIRHLAAGDFRQALLAVKRSLVLPAVLGRICPAPCEKACRRGRADQSVAIRMLHGFAGAMELAGEQRLVPACQGPSGRRVAIVGAGPAGLAAAFYLLEHGHACTIFDQRELAGGRLRDIDAQRLPRDIIDGEIDVLVRMGLELRLAVELGTNPALPSLADEYDAVVLAVGEIATPQVQRLGLEAGPHGIAIDKTTHRTSMDRVFAAGDATAPSRRAVRSIADGQSAAVCVDQFLRGQPMSGHSRPLTCSLGSPQEGELAEFMKTASSHVRQDAGGEAHACFVNSQTIIEATRCLHCDCRKPDTCLLRQHAQDAGANPHRFKGQRRTFEQDLSHALVIYESGKCIACGRCVAITQAAGERLGMAFVGRGLASRVRVPMGQDLAHGLTKTAQECVAACPTGALAMRNV